MSCECVSLVQVGLTVLCCYVIATFWYKAGEVGLCPFGKGENWMQDLEHAHEMEN